MNGDFKPNALKTLRRRLSFPSPLTTTFSGMSPVFDSITGKDEEEEQNFHGTSVQWDYINGTSNQHNFSMSKRKNEKLSLVFILKK